MDTVRIWFARRDDKGASAVEYGLLVAAIAGMIVIIAFALGGVVKTALFDNTCQVIKTEGANINGSCS